MIKSSIAFSQGIDDPEIDLTVLKSIQKETKNVLMIASTSCSVLTMLLDENIERLDVVDSNIYHLELIKLKIEALKHLSIEEYIDFIEDDDFVLSLDEKREYRINIFKQLRGKSKYDLSFWETDLNQECIVYGINQIGVFEQLFKELRESLTFNPLIEFNENEWDELFTNIFSRDRLSEALGEDAIKYPVEFELSDLFNDSIFEAIENFENIDNYFIDQIFKGHYEKDYPVYLKQINLDTIINNLDKINFINKTPDEYLKNNTVEYDFISTSNMTDWAINKDELSTFFENIKNSLSQDGYVLSKRLNGDYSLIDEMKKSLTSSEYVEFSNTGYLVRNKIDVTKTLKENSSSFLFSEIVVGKNEI